MNINVIISGKKSKKLFFSGFTTCRKSKLAVNYFKNNEYFTVNILCALIRAKIVQILPLNYRILYGILYECARYSFKRI